MKDIDSERGAPSCFLVADGPVSLEKFLVEFRALLV